MNDIKQILIVSNLCGNIYSLKARGDSVKVSFHSPIRSWNRAIQTFISDLALARRSKFSDTARNPAKQRSISSAVLRSLMSVGNATDKAEWRHTYGQIPLFGRPPWSICISGFYVSLENFIGFWTKSSREVGLPYMEPRRRLGRHIWLVMNYSCL